MVRVLWLIKQFFFVKWLHKGAGASIESPSSRHNKTMSFNVSYDLSSSHSLEDEHPATPSHGLWEPAENGMQDFLSRSWSMPTGEVSRTFGNLTRLDDPHRAIHGSGQSPLDKGSHISSRFKSQFHNDLYPLIPKQNHRLLSYDSYSPCQSNHSTPRRLEELKNLLWMQQELPTEINTTRCLHLTWFNRSIESFRNIIKRTRVKRWLKDRRKEKLIMRNGHVQAALSVASVAAAVAAVAAATAASAVNEKESRTGMAVASAAALVAAQCADFAEDMGADHSEISASLSSGGQVKSAVDILNMTASASSSLRGLTEKPQREAKIHAAASPCERQTSPSTAGSAFDDSEAECYYSHDLLSRGCEFLVCSNNSKLHWRFISVFLNRHKKVILKLQSRRWAGVFLRTEKRTVLDILIDVPAWPGRSVIHDGKEGCYFGLVTSHGTLEFECRSEFDYQMWTDGISHLLFVMKEYREKST